ncbi:MAG: sulfite exporter TauE/SafE family protein [Chloroflexi bacterium]|nr:sulfite exporter TauE/SafE family protein [Chloroflexota bacterium]
MEVFGVSSHVNLWQLVLLTVVSLGVGVLGGFVGLALGTMRLPALLLIGLPAPVAAGTNILVSTMSAATGLYRHLREGRVNLRVVAVVGLPSVAGAFVGGFASGRVPQALLVFLAGALVLWQGVELLMRARRALRQRSSGVARNTPAMWGATLTSRRAVLEGGIGLGIGLLGGAVGLILGSIRLPTLIQVLKMDPRVAAGTNLVIGFLMGSFGWIGHAAQGQVDYPLLGFMAVAGMVGTAYGARLTGRVAMETLLLVMGLVLSSVGVLLLWDAYLRAAGR